MKLGEQRTVSDNERKGALESMLTFTRTGNNLYG